MSNELGLGGRGSDIVGPLALSWRVEREEGAREGNVVTGRHCARLEVMSKCVVESWLRGKTRYK